MKNNLKKVTASIMAVVSLAVSATGIVTSAEDVITPVTPELVEEYSAPTGYVPFGDGAVAGIYCSSTSVNISTTRSVESYELYAGILEVYTGSVYNPISATSYNSTEVYLNTTGSNITGIKTRHYYKDKVNSNEVSIELVRYC